MSPTDLLPKQRRVYEFIRARIELSGEVPTIEEVRRELNLRSVATIHQHLRTLEQKGFIQRTPHSPRSITLVQQADGPQGRELPLLGVVAAGRPIEAVLTDERVWVPLSMCSRGNNFALRVRGDSMVEAYIQDGDIIVVEQRLLAENGETVVALVDNSEATVKRFYREGDEISLRPANRAYAPITLPAFRVQIQGIVRGVLHFS